MAVQILQDMETLFSALSDPTRLRLLNLMRDGEVCVCFFTEVLKESQPKISRHLAYLRKSGLVNARRDGKWMHYSIVYPAEEKGKVLLDSALDLLGNEEELRQEREELVRVCLSGTAPVTISKAPKPKIVEDRSESKEESAAASEKGSKVVEEEMETYLL